MICCLPFTYCSRACLEVLTALGQPLVFVYPTRRLIDGRMQSGAGQGTLDIRTPADLDETALDGVLAQYRDWADLHRSNLDAVAGFLGAKQGPVPLVDETDPTQIHTQLRRYGDAGPDRSHGQLMQAAVFMAMAHEFDRHQDDLSRELEAVNRSEQQMFKGLAGDADEMGAIFNLAGKTRQEKRNDPGLFCTDKRIQSWAVLASAAAPEAFLYLTTSKAVFDTICDAFTQMAPLVEWPLAAPGPAVIGFIPLAVSNMR